MLPVATTQVSQAFVLRAPSGTIITSPQRRCTVTGCKGYYHIAIHLMPDLISIEWVQHGIGAKCNAVAIPPFYAPNAKVG